MNVSADTESKEQEMPESEDMLPQDNLKPPIDGLQTKEESTSKNMLPQANNAEAAMTNDTQIEEQVVLKMVENYSKSIILVKIIPSIIF